MLITRTPFRISFCGGGSDLLPFYEKYGGCVLSTSIDKYMYISVNPGFDTTKTVLRYSKTEIVEDYDQIEHKIFRCVLRDLQLSGVEINCTADIPAGTGLGSSSTFTVGLLHTLFSYKGENLSKFDIACKACIVEIEKLKSPIGKQDQYAAALGGINFIQFHQDGHVDYTPVDMKPETIKKLEQHLVLVYLGNPRKANDILYEQNQNIHSSKKVDNLIKMCELAKQMRMSLEKNDINTFAEILNENWRLKRELASGVSNSEIDDLYIRAIKAGASGGKILGAGGGGFMLLFCEPAKQIELKQALGLRILPFKFENSGTTVIYKDRNGSDVL